MNEDVLALFTVFRGILNTELCHNGRKNVGNCQKEVCLRKEAYDKPLKGQKKQV